MPLTPGRGSMSAQELIARNVIGAGAFDPLFAKLGLGNNAWKSDGGYNEGGAQVYWDRPNEAAQAALNGYTFDWHDTGAGNTGSLTAYDPSGAQVGVFNQQDQSGLQSVMEWAALAAAGFGGAGLVGLGPLGGVLGGAGGAGSIGGIAPGGAGEIAAYGASLTPAEAAAGVGGLNIGGAGGAGIGGSVAGAFGGASPVASFFQPGAQFLGQSVGGAAAGGAAVSGFPWGSVLSAGASLLGGVGSADAQRRAGNTAADAQRDASAAGIAQQDKQFEAIQALLRPYVTAGVGAIGGQQDLLGLNGAGQQQSAIDAIRGSPAFTSMQQLGENRILANASATGGLRGGDAQGALAQFSPALLSQLIDQQYTRLGGLSSLGQNAAAGVGNAGIATGNNITTLLGQQGQAQAGAALSQGRATTGLINGITGAAGQFIGSGGLRAFQPQPNVFGGNGDGTFGGAVNYGGGFGGLF